ncbi:unnamed protein product [Phytomonas sp. EM1]|nr:unnamed protein product [Phytomonas sp. EM1]|eukprot:CCW61363.1 unnamed protein product [Phytomonas sp. isolate EM1]
MLRGASPLLAAALLRNAIGHPNGLARVHVVKGDPPHSAEGELVVKAGKEASPKVHAEDSLPSLDGWTSLASEPHVQLQPEIEPMPLVSFHKIRSFLTFMAVGAAVVGGLYFLLSIHIRHEVEEEQLAMEELRERSRLALLEREKLFPDFTAPNTYEEMQRLMQQQERELAAQEAEMISSACMLHSEVIFRLKTWWNRSLAHIQDAVDLFFTTLEQRRSSGLKGKIETTLRQNSYELVELHQIGQSGMGKRDV